MKDDTKYRLKLVNRLLKIAVMTFAWLMACVGVTAYSVYWLRQNANYNTEAVKQGVVPKRLNNQQPVYAYYQTYNVSYYNTNKDAIASYLGNHMDISGVGTSARFDFEGHVNCNSYDFTGISFRVSNVRPSGSDYYYIIECDLFGNPDTDFYYTILKGVYSSNSVTYSMPKGENLILYVANLEFDWSTGLTIYFDNVYEFLGNIFKMAYYSLDTTDFDFSYMPNYNKLFTYQLLPNNVFQYNGSNPVTPVDISYYVNCNFISNGKLFRGLSFNCKAVAFVSDNNGNVTTYDSLWVSSSDSYKLTLTSITYWYYGSNTGIDVCSLGVLEYRTQYQSISISSTPVWLTMNGFNWIDNNYKYLSIHNPTKYNATSVGLNYITASVCPFLSLSSYDALTFNVSENIIGVSVTDIGLSNVFTLMGSAFTGLAGIMAIQILPGLTLGLLVFIPLIATIIIVVLRLVKK